MIHNTELIDQLIHAALFSDSQDQKNTARDQIRSLAKEKGIISSSIYDLYITIGKGEIPTTFTVPAINIRTLTYQTATVIFSLMQKYDIGPVVFEIARSEIDYTDQRPDEYAVAILAGAIKANYKGPVFIQGDHYQLSKNRYTENPDKEVQKIKDLIKESIEAEFLNIDIDASTLVDLDKSTQNEQQQTNYNVTAELTEFIRNLEPKGQTISIGAEIGHIGGKNSTPEELQAFMEGYNPIVEAKNMQGISKISVQTGTSHGGIPLPDGGVADVKLDFNVIKDTGTAARETYHIGGVVQHGASTLPNELFGEFPKNKTLEIHLATGFQNIVFDFMPESIKKEMYMWIKENCKKEWETDWNEEQFIYKTRKKALGPFKKQLFELSEKDKEPILDGLEKQLTFLFEKLKVTGTKDFIDKYY